MDEKKEIAPADCSADGAVEDVSAKSTDVAVKKGQNGVIGRIKGQWARFSAKHPKGSKLIWQFIKFFIFSNGVTIFQFLVYTFLHYALGAKMAASDFILHGIELHWGG